MTSTKTHQGHANPINSSHRTNSITNTLPTTPRITTKTQTRRSKSRAHPCITIRGGRRPPAERAARRAAKITTPALRLIFTGWLGC